ncbi:hypothetical protein CEP54_015962 [Fusarium duplospermum]|uniref:Uncharacterized protein n=1 Tax=Fusarium duplospermum TaxID=1325734 RepID=A0A428NJH2_9HYPO|nr:hypothetical protein CEP54_015962 [Fusarium duplospermum]
MEALATSGSITYIDHPPTMNYIDKPTISLAPHSLSSFYTDMKKTTMVIQDDESPATAPADNPPEAPADNPLIASIDCPPEAPAGFPPVNCPPSNASLETWLEHYDRGCQYEHCCPPPQNEATASVSDEDDREPDESTTTCLPFTTNFVLLSYPGKANFANLKRLASSHLQFLVTIAFCVYLFHIFQELMARRKHI